MHKITSRWGHQNSIKVEWNIGKRCNYDCSYCPSEIHDNVSEHTNFDLLTKTVDQLSQLGKPVRLSFTGGEPCVHPRFQDLIRYARHKGIHWISVTTNGTRAYEFYSLLPVDQFVFSIHLEYDWRRIFNTIESVADNKGHKIIAQIMAHHDHMAAAKQLRDRCRLAEIPYTIRRIRWTQGDHDLFDDLRYHPNDLEWIKEQESTVQGNCIIDDTTIMHSNDIIKLHLNQYKDWQCMAGIESLMINWDGDVHRATCRVGGSLGNIYDGSFSQPTDPVICTRKWCTCSSDIPLTKVSQLDH